MKISNIRNIQSDYVIKSNTNSIKSEKISQPEKIGQVKSEKNRFTFDMSDKEPYQIIYNNATLNNSNSNKSKNELSDDEINEEINLRIYKQNYLDKSGIEFGSDKFKSWLEENKNTFPVPADAPAKLRKEVYNMLDSAKDPVIRYFLLRDFTRGFKKVKDHGDLNSYMKVTNNILKFHKDHLKLLKMKDADDAIIKKNIENFTEVVNEILTFRNRLDYLILDSKIKEK